MLTHFKNRFPNVAIILIVSLCATVRSPAQEGQGRHVQIRVDPADIGRPISPGFIGFGYETSAVAQTNYFTARNITLVQLYRNLGSRGLIRIGGNISDHTRYVPDGASAVHTERDVTIINRTNLADLAGFVRATGWQVMWGLNLGTESKAAAAEEAAAVAQSLGPALQSFEIGNEVDIHGGYTSKCDDFSSYHSNYLAYQAAVRTALPAARFSGPDVAGNLAWLRDFAKREGQGVQLLTHHYYRTGASRPGATIENLLRPDEAWHGMLQQLEVISGDSGVPFRINEINSFYGGGKAGVSDTFASALWCLDNMFVLASHGCAGVNMETDINQLGWISHYSPIVHDAEMACHVRPEYYGMLAFSLAGKGRLLKLTLDKTDINLTAYATLDDAGSLWLTAINKDLILDAQMEVALPPGYLSADTFWLRAPSANSTDHVTLAGVEVSADGQWRSGPPESATTNFGALNFRLPHASAVLLRIHSKSDH